MEWVSLQGERLHSPLQVTECRDRYMRWRFARLTPVIEVVLTTWQLSVVVNWQGGCWDCLVDFEAMPRSTPAGYACLLCPSTHPQSWSSREALWRDHVFEPFLAWVNTELSSARWLGLYQSEESGFRWAVLHRETVPETSKVAVVLPLGQGN
jgi:hypothetical protein